jgi:hypothetical protein
LQDTKQLGGGFFFKRGHATCGNAKVLFATLAYQLALNRRELKNPIVQSVDTDPSVLARGMDVQLHTLILGPCQLLQDDAPLVFLIDGLDECAGHIIQGEILRLIRSTAQVKCLRILVASRPEPHIRETLEEESFQGLWCSTNVEQSYQDVRTYLHREFLRIHHKHHATMRNIPTPWPSPQIVEMLVEKSSGYFIFASTVIKFIDDEYSRPSDQLDIIQNLTPPDSQSPYEALDQLYLQILSGVPDRYHSRLCNILCFILHYPGSFYAENIDKMLGLKSGDVSLILRPLHSVLDLSKQIRMHHASFPDFLNSLERSSIFCVGSPQLGTMVVCCVLKENTNKLLEFSLSQQAKVEMLNFDQDHMSASRLSNWLNGHGIPIIPIKLLQIHK